MPILRQPKRKLIYSSASHANAPKQEARAAKRIGGSTVPGSGAGAEKGDARKRGVARLECKNTIHSSFTVTLDMLRKIEDAAAMAAELPCIHIEFITKDGKQRRGAVCVVPEYVLDEIAARE